jgi:hypothetical protein
VREVLGAVIDHLIGAEGLSAQAGGG